MHQINPVFLIGTIGMLLTSLFHIVVAAVTSEETVYSSNLWMLYPVFCAFLLLGAAFMAKRKSPLKD